MLSFSLRSQNFELPLQAGVFCASHVLDEAWRSNSEGACLELAVNLQYVVPATQIDALYDAGIITISSDDLLENESPLLMLTLELGHVFYDAESGTVLMRDEFPRFPSPDFFEKYSFSDEVCKESTLWFPGFGVRSKIHNITFGRQKKEAPFRFSCSGLAKDARAQLEFKIDEKLDLQFDFEVKGYANEFIGFSEADIIKEIQDCFNQRYNEDNFEITTAITDTTHGGVRLSHLYKG